MRKSCLIIFLIFFIAGCARKVDHSDILRLRLKEDPTTLDLAYIVDVTGGAVAAKLYSGLVRFDENCKIVPDLAESWQISPDRCEYTFKLRKDCSITAEDIKKSFDRIISPQTLSPRAWIFDKVEEFKVIESYTFQIILKEPFTPFLSLLTMPNAYIEGTGPYILSKWEHDQRLVLKPNPDYFGPRSRVEGIEYRIIPEQFTAMAEFKLGNLDITELSPIQWVNMSGNICEASPRRYSQVGLNTYYIGFNCQKPLFKSLRVRQAFNYAIDKETIIKRILQGQAEPAGGPIPPALLKTKTRVYPYLPNRAKKMLSGVKFDKPLKIYVRAESQGIQIVEAIQHYLTEVGVKTEILPLEWSAFKEAVTEGKADLFLMSWWADYPDPENFLFPTFHSSNWGAGGNRARFRHTIIDKLIEEVQYEANPRMYEKLQRLINRQAPWIFLWHRKELIVAQPWVKGFKIYPVYNSDKGTDVIKNQNDKLKVAPHPNPLPDGEREG